MPKVEQFGANKQNLAFTPGAQAPTRSLDKFAGAQLASGLSDAGKALDVIHDDLTSTQAEDAQVQFERDAQTMLHNPDSGYLTTTFGKDAIDGAKATGDSLVKLRETYSASLSGVARDKFDRVAKNYTTGALDKVNIHAAKGQRDYRVSTNKALQLGVLESASTEDDPVKRADQLQLGLSHVRDGNDLNGITGPAAKKNLEDYKSTFHSSVMSSMADTPGKAAEALAYFKAHSSDLNHDDKIKMRDLTKTAGLLEDVQTKTDIILGKYKDARSGIASARKESDPETRKALTAAVKARYDENEVLKKRDISDRFTATVTKVMKKEGFSSVDIVDFSPAQITSLEKLKARIASGEPVTNDVPAYTKITSSVSNMSHKELSDTAGNFFALYGDKLDQTHYDRALNYVIAARDTATKPTKTLKPELTFQQAFKNVANKQDLSSKKDPERWGDLNNKAAIAVETMKAVKGREHLTTTELNDAISHVFVDEVLTPGIIFGTNEVNLNDGEERDLSKVFVMVGSDRIFVDKLPPERVSLITDSFFKVLGRAPSHQEVADLYVRKYGGSNGR